MTELKPNRMFYSSTAYGVLFANGTCLPYAKINVGLNKTKLLARSMGRRLGLPADELVGNLPPLNMEAAVRGKCLFVDQSPAKPLPAPHPQLRLSVSKMSSWATEREYDAQNGTFYASESVLEGLSQSSTFNFAIVVRDDGTFIAVTVAEAYAAQKRECLKGYKLHRKTAVKVPA